MQWTRSWTAWGAVLIAAVQGAEATGILVPGTGETLGRLAEAVGQLLIILGIRRAIRPV